ncbi:MAG TPA: hypothetical protein VJ761_11620 [Ktedonobacteraceae bacterium]|nr:hypothetical protein [Ktedonobacteraceae bacterium]
MNLLIMGGLFVIAAAAILGAVLLSISEQRAEKARANGVPTSVATNISSPAHNTSNSSGPLSRPAPTRQAGPVTIDRSFAARGDDQQVSALNGQFHELAAELRTLYQHAWELEQHLRVLTEAVDRIEHSQSGHFSIAEEAHAHSTGDGSQL